MAEDYGFSDILGDKADLDLKAAFPPFMPSSSPDARVASGVYADSDPLGPGLSAADSTFAPLSAEQVRRFARAFERNRSSDGFVSAENGRSELERTNLSTQVLQNIWHLSDLDRDGRLSLREFVCAVHLADRLRSGFEMPVEVRVDQQAAIARRVELELRPIGSGPLDNTEADKFLRTEDLSTADTLGVGFFSGARAPASSASGLRGKLGDAFASAGGENLLGSSEFDLGSAAPQACASNGSAFGTGGNRAAVPPESRPSSRVDLGGFPETAPEVGLGQLAAVFESVARLDAGGELRRLSQEVLEERRELERQLARRRGIERQHREARASLDHLREERRRVEVETAATKRKVSHIQDELGFVMSEVRLAEEDISLLKAAALPGTASSEEPGMTMHDSPEDERHGLLANVRAERQLLLQDQRAIEEVRVKLEEVLKQKHDIETAQQVLLEKQRLAEQDRGLMLTAIEAERSKLSEMRSQRLHLWEERAALEKEIFVSGQDLTPSAKAPSPARVRAERSPAPPASPSAFHSAPGARTTRRGVLQDDPPSVIYSSAPGPAHLGKGASVGVSFSRPPAVNAQWSTPVKASGAADRRGVRNETAVPLGGRDDTSLLTSFGSAT